MTKKDMRRAAFHLKQWAKVLLDTYKNGSDEETDAALAEAAEMADLSQKLYAEARANKVPNA